MATLRNRNANSGGKKVSKNATQTRGLGPGVAAKADAAKKSKNAAVASADKALNNKQGTRALAGKAVKPYIKKHGNSTISK